MQALKSKKFSVLGLVILAASAVTAAVIPNKVSDNKVDALGTLTVSSLNGSQVGAKLTCVATNVRNSPTCNETAGSGTTGDALNPSEDTNRSNSTAGLG